MSEPITPVSGTEESTAAVDATQPPPEKVTFTPAQQLRLTQIIRHEQGKAASAVRAELAASQAREAALKAELELHRSAVSPELAEAREKLASESTLRSAAEARESNARRNIVLREACEAESVINTGDAVTLLADSVVWHDGQLVGVDGRAVADLVRDFVASRPHLVRSTVRPGTGAFESRQTAPVEQYKLEDYWGPKSNGDKTNVLAKSNPKLYSQLRRKAQAAGLVR